MQSHVTEAKTALRLYERSEEQLKTTFRKDVDKNPQV